MFSKLFGAAKLTKKGLERDDKFVITDIYTEWRNKFWALKPKSRFRAAQLLRDWLLQENVVYSIWRFSKKNLKANK